jgi:hypothetical protein
VEQREVGSLEELLEMTGTPVELLEANGTPEVMEGSAMTSME